jgi:(1->4)-alpha-D-glucan 1-alpha-D-glucosylmutase
VTERRAGLERLCRRFGIATEYHDIWGTRHAVPDENLVALLGAFDVEASDEAAVAAAERGAEAALWREALPPVVALAAGDAGWRVELRLPETLATLRWSVHAEDGTEQRGECAVDALERLDATEIDGVRLRCCRLAPGVALPAGYHALRLDGVEGRALLIAAPARCWLPPALEGDGRVWGPSVQLYAVRSDDNWGIGDFGDLGRIVEQWAARGAGIVGVNPLHALFGHNPAHASPYSPSSRQRLNPLYLDVEAVEELRTCEAAQRLVRSIDFQDRLERLRACEQVDYAGVAAAKHEVLALLYRHFREHHLGAGAETAHGRAFRAFQAGNGEALRRYALFEALQARFHAEDGGVWGWPVWPEGWRDPQAPLVQAWADEHRERVEYHEYVQWQAERQLARVDAHGRRRGLAVGLYLDLAVSVDRAGADTWAHAAVYAPAAGIGAPPDEYNQQGQAWGLPPLRPDRLRASGYRLFIDTLRENMRHAGALRIDHVMGLMRLFWIPPGHPARDGAYVHYRADELMAIVALESQRNRCLVIGEDLGTVLDEMRAAMTARGVLSYRLLYFERDAHGGFRPPDAYPRDALVAVSTHDLPTFCGWWSGRDLAWRLRLGLFGAGAGYDEQVGGRAEDRRRLVAALRAAGAVPEGVDAEAPLPAPELLEGAHAYAAATPCAVMVLQLEDAVRAVEQANLPGTTHEHPNWRRKLPFDLDTIGADPAVLHLAATLARLRPAPPLGPPEPAAVEARVPRATYRLQLHHRFTFDDAIAVLPYLVRLGVSHVYCSPVTRARPGSLHGYDVVAHDEFNPELGGRAGFERFCAALREQGLGLLLDLVPNHMGVFGAENRWWSDVLENGPASPYAQHFDIDWDPLDADLQGKVLLPVLGERYGQVLDSGELRLVFEADAGSFAVHYHEHRFPLDVRGYAALLRDVEADGTPWAEPLAALADAFAALPPRDAVGPADVTPRAHEKERLKARLARLAAEAPGLAAAIEQTLPARNEAEALHALLEAQAWRLAYWRVAADEINYRRFFDINSLAALRIERQPVFEATQGLALELVAAGRVDGLRIDHPDGLRDPGQYFLRLQRGCARRAGLALPEVPGERPARPVYLVAEKIAASHEDVPESWSVHGTTGYRYAAVVNGLFVDTGAAAKFDRIWRGFTQDPRSFEEHAYDGKRAIMRGALASELTVLATELLRIARAHRLTRDHTFNNLRRALAEVAACLPVYRTYIVEAPSAQDRRYIDWAVAQARRRSVAADASVFDFVRTTLLGEAVEGAPPALRERALRLAVRFQQFSAPVAAKGVEDTAFYRYLRLASLNEVGGDPARFGVTVRAFHGASADRCARWPHTMLATSTHDHKRSADVRCRIDVLSEMPAAWRLLLRRWSRMNRMHRGRLDGGAPAPSPADEYLLYQTLIGTLPAGGLDEAGLAPYRERIRQYMVKAAREAKTHTSWISPDEAYEAALDGFVGGLLGRLAPNLFLDDLTAQVRTLAWYGALNSLSTTLLKFTSPGVPDIYQGHEVVKLTLVDPDNRQPVDYPHHAERLAALGALDPADAGELAAAPHDGRAKLWITWRLLALRRAQPALFRDGDYLALKTGGRHAEHVVAFARRHAGATLVAVAGRLFAGLGAEVARPPLGEAVWGDTWIAVPALKDGTRLVDALTGERVAVENRRIRLAAAFARFPGAVLVAEA